MNDEKGLNVLSLFNGMGCGAIALEREGIAVNKYYSSEIDKFAVVSANNGFPSTIQLGDVTKWREWDIEWEKIDLLLAGSPCFVSGTKVFTSKGFKNIEDVCVGDEVLTHKLRFRKVLKVGGKVADIYSLSAQGIFNTSVTPEHPYYIRQKTNEWNKEKKVSERVFSQPKWIAASELRKEDFIGIPILNTSENVWNLSADDCWLLGRYVADGYTRKHKRKNRNNSFVYQTIFCIGKKKVEEFKLNVSRHFTYVEERTAVKAQLSDMNFIDLAEMCGRGAENKVVPMEILNLPKKLLSRFIDGYMSGDGCFNGKFYKATSVSKELITTLSVAITKVYGVNVNVEFTKRPSTTVIEGRTVNQKDTYTLYFRKEIKKQSNAKVIDGIVWTRFKGLENLNKKEAVINFEVEEDNSYTANGAIVHNCQGFSMAGKGLAFDDPRSKLFFVFVEILEHIKKVNPGVKWLLENVRMKKEHEAVISRTVGIEPVVINSALVSAQNRLRLYWTNIYNIKEGLFDSVRCAIPQPKDLGIVLKDILEKEVDEKYYLSNKALNRSLLNDRSRLTDTDKEEKCGSILANQSKQSTDMISLIVASRGRNPENPKSRVAGLDTEQMLEERNDGKTNCLTSVQKDNLVMQITGSNYIQFEGNGYDQDNRAYLEEGKSGSLDTKAFRQKDFLPNQEKEFNGLDKDKKARTLRTGGKSSRSDKHNYDLLKSDFRIRRLTPVEVCRLQGVPDDYFINKETGKYIVSETQIYRQCGNGWNVDTICHILKYMNK